MRHSVPSVDGNLQFLHAVKKFRILNICIYIYLQRNSHLRDTEEGRCVDEGELTVNKNVNNSQAVFFRGINKNTYVNDVIKLVDAMKSVWY